MAYPVSLQTLVQRALQRANLQGATALITPSEAVDMVNASIADWYDHVRLSTWGGQYYRVSQTFATIANQDTYALPANFLALISADGGLTLNQIPPQQVNLVPVPEERRNDFLNPLYVWATGWIINGPVYYLLWANSIVFRPIPDGGYYYQLNYVPAAPTLSRPQDTIDSINSWDEYIVLDVAIKALIKYGQPDLAGFLRAERDRQEARIQAAAPQRDQTAGEGIHEQRCYGMGTGRAWDEL